uniref:Pyroglutamyl-peptidase 1 n=1 Tax=Caenorhabditis tropicalis TaxID=1561998 RepID=A0A1I7U5Y2_9PELO
MTKKKVIVTGFGPFRGFEEENPSSVVIDELKKTGIDNVDLELHKITVAYDDVSKKVPELWNEHQPDLVIHLGAHQDSKTIKFEQQAFSDGYCSNDVNGCTPKGNRTTCESGELILKSCIDCDQLVTNVTEKCGLDGKTKYGGLIVKKSEDPGRYLCGYSYFLSLHQDCSKSLFIHVPAFEGECTKEAVSEVIRETIKSILGIF